jgi:hypothetical protein
MTIIGTSHFVNFTKACDYYKGQGYDDLSVSELERFVRDKLDDGEIELGKPELNIGETLLLIDEGTRYAVSQAKT